MDRKDPKERGSKDSDDPDNQNKDVDENWSAIIDSYADGTIANIIMTLFTFYALFAEDIRVAAFGKDADFPFQIVHTIAFSLFLLELIIFSVVRSDYKWSFFFWLDLIATFSLVADISWIWYPISSLLHQNDNSSNSRGNTTQVGARASRIVRLVRLIRLVRIVKLYKYFSKANDEEEQEKLREQAKTALNAKQAALKRVEASRLGKYLSEQTTRKVIVGVLVMLLLIPLLQVTDTDNQYFSGLTQIFWFGRSSSCSWAAPDTLSCPLGTLTPSWTTTDGWRRMVFTYSQSGKEEHRWVGEDSDSEMKYPLLWLRVPNFENAGRLEDIDSISTTINNTVHSWYADSRCTGTPYPSTCPYRESEVEEVAFLPQQCTDKIDCQQISANSRFLVRDIKKQDAIWSIITTIFVCTLLGTLAYLFSQDTQNLVIAPIEKMVNIVKQLANDPLRKPEIEPTEDQIANTNEDEGLTFFLKKRKRNGPQLETSVLEQTILKIGQLLQVGFGEAGAEIIGNNMRSGDGELNIMIPGKRVKAIFGFLDIRRFTDATEALQEDVMHFVNLVGRISHQCTHRWEGAANKNVGDAFLFTWKVENGDVVGAPQSMPSGSREETHGQMRPGELANKALIAFIKCLVEIRRNPQVKEFENDPRMRKRFAYTKQKSILNDGASTLSTDQETTSNVGTDIQDGSRVDGGDAAMSAYSTLVEEYKLRAGYALHYGWAIEGAIGSDYKIDASYLSPHVYLTEKLQDATKSYVVPLLMSEPFYNKLSGKAKMRTRKIDIVKTALVPEPIGVYCFDINDEEPISLPIDRALAHSAQQVQQVPKPSPIIDAEGNEVVRTWHLPGDIVPPADLIEDLPFEHLYGAGAEYVFAFDADIAAAQAHLPTGFLQMFREAFCYYAECEWEMARDLLDKCLDLFPNDGPSLSLYAYMELHEFKAPKDWVCRDFDLLA